MSDHQRFSKFQLKLSNSTNYPRTRAFLSEPHHINEPFELLASRAIQDVSIYIAK
jgi:hypothetical protein